MAKCAKKNRNDLNLGLESSNKGWPTARSRYGCASLFCSGVCAWSDVTPSADRGLTTDASARHSADLLQCLLLSPKRTLRAINMISAKCLPLSGQGRARRGLMLLSFELSNRSSYCELVSASSSKAVCSSLRQRSTKNRSSVVRLQNPSVSFDVGLMREQQIVLYV